MISFGLPFWATFTRWYPKKIQRLAKLDSAGSALVGRKRSWGLRRKRCGGDGRSRVGCTRYRLLGILEVERSRGRSGSTRVWSFPSLWRGSNSNPGLYWSAFLPVLGGEAVVLLLPLSWRRRGQNSDKSPCKLSRAWFGVTRVCCVGLDFPW